MATTSRILGRLPPAQTKANLEDASKAIFDSLKEVQDNENLEQASKAIFDSLKEVMTEEIKLLSIRLATTEKRLLSMETDVLARVKGLENDVEKKTHELTTNWNEQVKTQRHQQDRELDRVTTMIKSIQTPEGIPANAGVDIVLNVSRSLEDRFQKQLVALETWVKENIVSVKEAHVQGMESLKSILQSLPAPVANVYNEREVINVHVPEAPPAQVVVKAAEVPPAHVTVNVPEALPAQIILQPNEKPRRKTFTYDDSGRPHEVWERVIDEQEALDKG